MLFGKQKLSSRWDLITKSKESFYSHTGGKIFTSEFYLLSAGAETEAPSNLNHPIMLLLLILTIPLSYIS